MARFEKVTRPHNTACQSGGSLKIILAMESIPALECSFARRASQTKPVAALMDCDQDGLRRVPQVLRWE